MENTEGSQVISQVYKARKNLELRLSNRQMTIILGSILGDAYVHPQGKICFEHSATQKEYLLWKYTELQTIAYPSVAKVTRLDKRTNTYTMSYRFFLRQYFRPLRKLFYTQQGKKVISKDIISWFNPLLLAVWYMDDGHLDRKKYPELMTENFTYVDVKQLTKALEEKFHIKSSITSKRRIRISTLSADTFFQLIEPHIHENLKYKLP